MKNTFYIHKTKDFQLESSSVAATAAILAQKCILGTQ